MFGEFGINAGYVEQLHNLYRQAPQSVAPEWRSFFEARESGDAISAPPTAGSNGRAGSNGTNGTNGSHTNGDGSLAKQERLFDEAASQARVFALVNAYRVRGHLFAKVDPLGGEIDKGPWSEIDLATFNLAESDLDTTFPTAGVAGLPDRASLRTIIAHLQATYCSAIGVEYTHVEDLEARKWLQDAMESTENRATLSREESLRVLAKLTDAEIFEQFIHKNYIGAKRFSLEGGESMIAMLDLCIEKAGAQGVEEIVIGMAHRGRLNVMINILNKDVRETFAAFDDKHPDRFIGGGDVKYHHGYSTDVVTSSGQKVHLSLAFNPSHLEWVNPVVEGRVRAKQDRGKRQGVVPFLIHGDAAFMGQGVVPETLNMAGLEGYTTGGTLHLVVNNQIGFTTVPEDSRSTRYCTDIARMMKVPVFHVNGEDPEAVIQVTRLAVEWRQRFAQDVVIDMYCYRKFGHNETDEPRFTQPVMYSLIDQKPSVREMYVRKLVAAGLVSQEQADSVAAGSKEKLDRQLAESRKGDYLVTPNTMGGVWASYLGGPEKQVPEVRTAVPKERLTTLLEELNNLPADFTANDKVKKGLEKRITEAEQNDRLYWETAEQLAYATILEDKHPIRLSGQDARRGTFSHRHAAVYDAKTGRRYVPLSEVAGASGTRFEVWDSPLSEAGVLGFEYGYSLDTPEGLVIWEAQFGDFANSGQVIIDQFFASAEDKWLRLSGLTLFLPHGYEGQGPEHSSARIERFLQMAAEDNMQVMNLTTPANLFHALRRQVIRPWRKPLVVFTPKSLLRNADATSSLEDLASGAFQRVILDDPKADVDPAGVKKILLCSGKVYYDLAKRRAQAGRKDVAILRLEELYPLNDAITRALSRYKESVAVTWVQEEPRNMGAWYFLNANLHEHIGDRPLNVVSRASSASPATGSKASHELEQKMLLDEAFSA